MFERIRVGTILWSQIVVKFNDTQQTNKKKR